MSERIRSMQIDIDKALEMEAEIDRLGAINVILEVKIRELEARHKREVIEARIEMAERYSLVLGGGLFHAAICDCPNCTILAESRVELAAMEGVKP